MLVGGVVTGVHEPPVPGVGVVTVAVLLRLPVAPGATVPVIVMVAVCPAGRSASAAVPVHAPIAAPFTLYCGF
jgi:hypothetical protein